MATSDYQQWVEIAKELGFQGEEIRKFVIERQSEAREERAKEREEKKASEMRQIEDDRLKREDEKEKRLLDIEERKEEERLKREDEKEKRVIENERIKMQNEKELELRKIEAEIKTKEIEARMRYDISQAENQEGGNIAERQEGNSGNRGMVNRNIKFPTFNEHKDCLDAYLLRFERTMEAYGISKDLWVLTLARHLEGKALEVYQRLTPSQAKEYTILKESLLKRFQLTEGGYRRKFKESRIETGESPSQFIERLRRYMKQWLSLAGYTETYEGLENLILRDQFFITCPNDLRIFIKEKGKISLKEMLEYAESYNDAHGQRYSETTVKPKQRFSNDQDHNKAFNEKAKDKFAYAANKFRTGNESHEEMNKQRFAHREFSRETTQTAEKSIICYICKMGVHKAFQCPNKSKGIVRHTAAAIQVFENSQFKMMNEQNKYNETMRTDSDDRPETQIKKCEPDNKVTSALIMEADFNDQSSFDNVASSHTVRVNNKQVPCIYDSGATCCVVSRNLINESDLTGKQTMCTLINGSTHYYPTADITIDSKYFTGQVEALLMENPIKPVIIGNVKGLKYLVCKDGMGNMISTTDKHSDDDTLHETGYIPNEKHVLNIGHERQKNLDVRTHKVSNTYRDVQVELLIWNTSTNDITDSDKHRQITAAIETRASDARSERYI